MATLIPAVRPACLSAPLLLLLGIPQLTSANPVFARQRGANCAHGAHYTCP